jgi:hypothetical protein
MINNGSSNQTQAPNVSQLANNTILTLKFNYCNINYTAIVGLPAAKNIISIDYRPAPVNYMRLDHQAEFIY